MEFWIVIVIEILIKFQKMVLKGKVIWVTNLYLNQWHKLHNLEWMFDNIVIFSF
jgi:hypothetical protein